jgi:spore coat protein U-like protein
VIRTNASARVSPRRVAALLLCAPLCVPCAPVLAAATGSFSVTTTLANACTVSATNVGFGAVNAGSAAVNTAGRVTLTCNKGATVTSVALNNGAHATGQQKRMRNAASGEFLRYRIDRPTGATFNTCPAAGAGPEWNSSNRIVATPLFATTGGAKLINICASITAAQYPSAGSYSDTVRITVNYN